MACNICSLTIALNNSWKIWNEGYQINITKNNKTINFDQTYKVGDGFLSGVKITPIKEEKKDNVNMISLENAYKILGHTTKEKVMATAKK